MAADRAMFMRKHPGITNLVASWTPPMNSHLVLADSAGIAQSEVNYSDDGDWGARVLTSGRVALKDPVFSLAKLLQPLKLRECFSISLPRCQILATRIGATKE